MTSTAISRRLLLLAATFGAGVWLTALGPAPLAAQPPGKGKAADPAFAADRDGFHALLDHRADIRRTVKNIPTGVETVTESANPEVAAQIREHVAAMHRRVKDGKGIHLRDPLFAAIFGRYDKITMKVEPTKAGVKVTETSDDPFTARLVQAHAAVVTKFIENGHAEVRKNHPLPESPDRKTP
ncbi:MAG: hypothetical protein U0871_13695 [Gemmataceae bacterium]